MVADAPLFRAIGGIESRTARRLWTMLRITDRYVLREIVPPFLLGLLVLTFVLMLDPLMNEAEELIAKGVDGVTIANMMITLIPQGLGLALPMALLMGILIGLGRMSTDRETVALQACGVSVYRMLGPVALLAVLATVATFYVIEVAVPEANQRFRELMLRVLTSRAEGEVKPRVFYDGFDDLTLYVREISPAGWSDVFLADSRDPARLDVSVAEYGRLEVDRERQTVDLVLYGGTRHRSDANDPAAYELHEFDDIRISIGAESVFPQSTPQPGLNELRLPALRQEAERMLAAGESPHAPIMEMHERFSIPIACLVFALVGVGLGITTRKDAKSSSFALGIGVIFVYYVSMYLPEAMAKGALVSPHLAKWLPNLALGLAGLVLIVWRSHLAERPIVSPLIRRRGQPGGRSAAAGAGGGPEPAQAHAVKMAPGGHRGLSLLDWYVLHMYLRWVSMALVGLLGIFYLSTFIDLSDKLFKGQTSMSRLLEYFWFATPQFVYFVLPISALLATLVTIGALTRSSELTVMKACGISLARAALPMFALSLVWSACLFALEEGVLGQANRRAEAIRHEIRSGSPPPSGLLHRRWIAGTGTTLYHSRYVDHERDAIEGLSVYELEDGPWRIHRRTYAARATFTDKWEGQGVWMRRFPGSDAEGRAPSFTSASEQALPFVDAPETFRTEQPDPDVMGFRELDRYIETLRARGLDVVGLVVALHRKASFPFVSFVLTLIAVPFAVTTGSRGALYGVGAGIVLAFSYWVILSIFGAIGSAGLLTPALAAWSPNVLFGGTAAYLLLAARS